MLVLILITYVLSVTITQEWAGSIVLLVQIVTIWLILRTSEAPRSVRRFANATLIIAAVAAVMGLIFKQDVGARFLPAASGLLYLVAPFCIARFLIRRNTIDRETVLGAIATYLLIGMFFAFLYRSTGANASSPFFGAQGNGSFPQDLFFSFTTVTTTGYGNLVPAGNPGETFAVLEMVVGQLFLVTVLTKVVSAYRPFQNGPQSKGNEDAG